MRILLVEDEAPIAWPLAEQMRAAGHLVDCAASGEQALSLLGQRPYDAAAIDLVLPVATGDAVAAEATRRGVAVVLMSAATRATLSAVDDLRRALESIGHPVHGVMLKPITAEALLLALGQAARAVKESTPHSSPEGSGSG